VFVECATRSGSAEPLSPSGPFLHPYIQMPEWLTVVLVAAAYIALMKWVLPRFGVPT
jgi:hypothetical protein